MRCIRIKTNIDLRDVRINGFKYNSLDLESKIVVPGRNQLIVDTYLEYVKNKSTVVFCTSVDHAQKMEAAFREKGIAARSISGSTKTSERRKILYDYDVNVLDISQTILSGLFSMIMVVDVTSEHSDFDAISRELAALGERMNLQVRIQNGEIFDAMHHI